MGAVARELHRALVPLTAGNRPHTAEGRAGRGDHSDMTETAIRADPVLEHITRTILQHCAPRRIVLYGSRARGDAHADSDYDVMVELDETRQDDLELTLIKSLFDEDVDVFVTTAAHFAAQRDDVGLLAYLIDREGKVIYARDGFGATAVPQPKRVSEPRRVRPASAAMWIKRAENDYRAAGSNRDEQLADASCFHAHQCAEKYLKAVIISLHRTPPRTHRLGRLLDLCPENLLRARPVRDACAFLRRTYRLSRYPPEREPTQAEARIAVDAAVIVRTAARALLDAK